MRIAFIVDTFPSLSETFILNQITGLIDLGHDVEIFAGTRPVDRDFHSDIQKYDLIPRTFFHNDKPYNRFVRFIEASWLFFTNFHKNPWAILRSLNFFRYGRDASSLTYFYKVILFICIGKFDILQCHFGPNGNLGALLKELGIKGKLVTMFHGYGIRQGIEQGGDIYKRLFEQGDCFLSISAYNREHLIQFGADENKIITHPVGIDLRRFSFQEKQIQGLKRPTRIITIGRFVKEKGFSDGLSTIHKLVYEKGITNIEYHIVGDGQLQGELTELVVKYKLNNYVRFLGAQNQDGVNKILHDSDIYFLPSIAEALPVVLMEAQAVCLPVVATDVGSVSQLVIDGKNGFLVPSGDSTLMAEKLAYLIANPLCWQVMGKKGRAIIEEHYDIRKLNEQLESIYKNLIRVE